MNPAVEKFVKPLIDTSIQAFSNSLSGGRQAAVSSARFIARGKKPVEILTHSGLTLNKISHRSIARVLNTQAHMLEGTLLATAERIETAANASSLRDLVNEQVALMPATRKRLAGDARKTLNVLIDARAELKELVNETIAEFKAAGAPRKATKKAARRTTDRAKTTTKKTAKKVRKTTAKAKKTVAK